MTEQAPLARINDLTAEEHELRSKTTDGLDEAGRVRLQEIELELDQCWDLLRQRDARREFGLNPNEAQTRPEGVVEGYQQ